MDEDLKLSEYKALALSHTASGQQNQDLNPSVPEVSAHGFSPRPHTLHSRLKAPEKNIGT